MYLTFRRTLVTVSGVVSLGLLLVAPVAQAQIRVNGGSTTLEVDRTTAASVLGAGIAVSPVAPGRGGSSGYTLPLVRGSISRRRVSLTHSGGLALARGAQRVSLTNFVVTFDRTPDVTAVVNGGSRVSILDLAGRAPRVSRTRTGVRVSNVTVRLTPAAANTLNTTFAQPLFRPRQALGQTTTRARVARRR